ncbi:tail protein X [Afipia carboxidovorans]|uniref:tail protein X n=1 Tax=Afipia carboxidovorans TaxID=40137 RepID=UPI0030847675|nr:hypothetical protein CRBSH125_08550 [Afipia carboxidovorans]
MSIETYIVVGDMMLDQILWQRFRRKTPGLLERVLDMNPGLAGLGPVIPNGTSISIPIDTPSSPAAVPVVKLWD